MYIYNYVRTHTCIYIHICMHIHIYAYIYIYIYIYTYTSVSNSCFVQKWPDPDPLVAHLQGRSEWGGGGAEGVRNLCTFCIACSHFGLNV